ncbi:tRNA modification GTPase trmE [Allosphingosinicella indica]|uniref:tRNA modification GTPase MnmE n=1 Tax=Allosphingosinicella indica TaxID=941907 RepID=A0A1X7G4I8_9SPHN|nr:tRNA modification GTPase trmE [Allosphingosinicella indica]
MSGVSRDTIFALSSGQPPAAIAVIRISGPRAQAAVSALAGKVPAPRRATFSTLFARDGQVLDNALILWLPGPDNATGEDAAELHLHGGRSVVAAVNAALTELPGLRAAEPGEFTRRAYENGRIDLAEAEGLADLLAAETESQRRAALTLAGGALSRRIADWQEQVLKLAAELEAAIDFADEGDVIPVGAGWHNLLRSLHGEIAATLARPDAERLRDGVRVVIAGPPNAGKSSLLNALIGREAAIISPIAGTTRDVIEAPVAIDGIPFLFADTAGLRGDSDDPIEEMGIARAKGRVAAADIVLWLGNISDRPDHPSLVTVSPRCDVIPVDLKADVATSSLTGAGLATLTAMIAEHARAILPAETDIAINWRHRAELKNCCTALEEAQADDLILAAESLRVARHALDRITGRAGVEDMLDALFGRFCIGK